MPDYSYPKSVYVGLDHYEFFHSPSRPENVDKRFRGRAEIEKKLISILASDQVKSGAYLVTGYRGAGKTSLVNKALNSLNERHRNKYVTIRINLGHEDLKEKDILKLIANALLDGYANWLLGEYYC
ncbi:MAG: hypothetical protein AAGA64_12015 [Bacteroidota bacterium]